MYGLLVWVRLSWEFSRGDRLLSLGPYLLRRVLMFGWNDEREGKAHLYSFDAQT